LKDNYIVGTTFAFYGKEIHPKEESPTFSYQQKTEDANIEELRKVQSKPELDTVLLKQNIKHFSQAHRTPFTVSPLIDIVCEDGCTDQALQIREGNIPDRLPKYSQLLLQKLTRVRDPISLQFTLNDMIRGFTTWREKMTTSPSGKHLGIYIALTTAVTHNIQYENPTKNASNNPQTHIAYKCLQLQHSLIESFIYTRQTGVSYKNFW
jgi:hypothetical protein